jgi:CheY-like chemotaxis protein
MSKIDELKQYTKDLNILFVEDALDICQMYHFFFDDLFNEVYEAHDGLEALQLLKDENKRVDLILTDQLMPNMNGLDMIKAVREFNDRIPIILVTSSKELNELIDAINLSVTNFVEKPINYEDIINSIEMAIQKVIVEQLSQKTKEQELEILKYKSAYSNFQEGEAFKKQLNIIKNDLFHKRFDHDEDVHTIFDFYYKPKDTLSGDTYSIRTVDENKVFFFIIDAMGKGISASVSTIVSTSFINYYFEERKQLGTFDMKSIIHKYIDFIRYEILEDEIISAVFGTVDLSDNSLEVATFSMPPVLALTKDGEVEKIGLTNLPISAYIDDFRVQKVPIDHIQKIIFYSDGLAENTTKDGVQYLTYLQDDFVNARSKSELIKLFNEKIVDQEDDTTLIYFENLDLRNSQKEKYVIPTAMKSIDEALELFGEKLDTFDVDMLTKIKLEGGFTELVMNAYEHGNLEIGFNQKQHLIENGQYNIFLLEQERKNKEKNIIIHYYLNKDSLYINIVDQGKGFDTSILKSLMHRDLDMFHGRGVMMSSSDFDLVYYNEVGNSVLFGKKLR